MNEINKIDEKELAKYINQWAAQNNLTKEHFWERNPVGIELKRIIKSIGKWKYRARGNPRKGYLALLKKNSGDNQDW